MLIGAYRFHCRFTSPATLPEYKGSMLRGAFGHALKRVTCALRRKECSDCLLAATCVYSLVFETAKSGDDHPAKERIAALPHPYVLQPPLTNQHHFQPGEPFDFGLLLFGRANDFLPHIIYAFEQMGATGLRPDARTGPAQFSMESVRAHDAIVYDGARKTLDRTLPLQNLLLGEPPSEPVSTLTVRLLTPLRVKQANDLQDTLPFHLLIRAALRRISTLENAHGQGEPPLDYPGLVKRASQITVARSDCRWQEIPRYSNRQQTAMQIGGILGSIDYAGDLTEFLPLLRYCGQTHLGKQTTFGLGQMEVDRMARGQEADFRGKETVDEKQETEDSSDQNTAPCPLTTAPCSYKSQFSTTRSGILAK